MNHIRAIKWALNNGFRVEEVYSPIQREGSSGFYVVVKFFHPDPEYWTKVDRRGEQRRKRRLLLRQRIQRWLS